MENDDKLICKEDLINKNSSAINFRIPKGIIALIAILMPYIGIFFIILKKPFSRKVNTWLSIYCVSMCAFLILHIAIVDKHPIEKSSTIIVNQSSATKPVETTVDSQNEKENTPFCRVAIEDKIKSMYNEGLDFSTLDYVQWDPMGNGLYHCKNTFVGKMTKKEHTYLARIGYDSSSHSASLYYLAIDGQKIYWDEDGETKFIDKK